MECIILEIDLTLCNCIIILWRLLDISVCTIY